MCIQYEQLNEKHVKELARLEKECFSDPWSEATFMAEISNKIAFYIIAVHDSKVIGYVGMWKICGEGHITNIAISPQFRRRGIAHTLIQKLIDECYNSSINYITLEVRKSNIPAQNLYEKLGFVVCGERKNYYDGIENALIMSLFLTENHDELI